MAIPNDDDLFLSVEQFLESVPAIVTVITDDECELTDDMLPAAMVMIGEGEQLRTNSSFWDGEDTVEIGVLLSRLCGDSLEEQRAQMLLALALRNVIPDAYARQKRLLLSGQQLGEKQFSPMRKSRLETRPWGNEVYYATTYRFTITTSRN